MEQSELLQFVIGVLERLGIRYAVVGSFASGIWGETRFTQDIDIVVQLDLASASQLFDEFPINQFYISQAAIQEAVKLSRPFNVIHPESGNKIDFMVASATPWSEAQLSRRIRIDFSPSVSGYVAAPEDVILGKLIYYREGGSDKHLRDIASILRVSTTLIDRSYLKEQVSRLGLTNIWQSIEKVVE